MHSSTRQENHARPQHAAQAAPGSYGPFEEPRLRLPGNRIQRPGNAPQGRQTKTEELQAERNALSKQIGQAKRAGEDASEIMARAAAIPEKLSVLEKELEEIRTKLNDLLLRIPNLPHESVPVGKDETENVEVRRWGTPREFDFPIKDHSTSAVPRDGL